jgi:hypothetical protein
MGRFIGVADDGRDTGFVAATVPAGGGRERWFAWRRDGTPDGDEVGFFASPQAAMAAVDSRL